MGSGQLRIHLHTYIQFLDPLNKGENINYWHSDDSATVNNKRCDEDAPKQGRRRQLNPKDFFFNSWENSFNPCRLRQGFKEEYFSHVYGISQTRVSRITISWVDFMFLKFCKIPGWPSRAKVDQHKPADFKDKYPSTRVISDCTKIRCQMPKSLRLNSQLFSS